MELRNNLQKLSEKVELQKTNTLTEEAIKTAFVMPFLIALGYDVFNPLEIVPEYTCDIGIKKGEKIDYAILKDSCPIILIECKHWGENLNIHSGQLLRYFHVSKAKFGILTNGIEYKFYTDLESPNKMDEKPFLTINLTNMKDSDVEELKKFEKSNFDIENIINTANELKYTAELKAVISQEMENPTPEIVKFFSKQVYTGQITAKVLEQFTVLVKKSFQQLNNELVTGRLKTALQSETEKNIIESKVVVVEEEAKIETTEEELEAIMIIKAIARQSVDVSRIHYRDAQSYCALLLDNNNRKTICRLYFGEKKKSISFLDENKKDVKYEIKSLDELFGFTEQILKSIEVLG